MSTEFNPNVPSNNDSVYDAYFSFAKNMEAINNLLGIDHFNGTEQNYRGMHRSITFPSTITPQNVRGSMGVLFTDTDNNNPTSSAPILKFANSNGSWEVLLKNNQYKDQLEEPELRDQFTGQGFVQLPNGFTILWARGPSISGTTGKFLLPVPLKRIFFANVFHCKQYNTRTFAQDDKSRSLNGLNWEVGLRHFVVTNPFSNTDLNFQLIALGLIQPNP